MKRVGSLRVIVDLDRKFDFKIYGFYMLCLIVRVVGKCFWNIVVGNILLM